MSTEIVTATPEELSIAARVMAISSRHRNTCFNKLITEWLDDMESTLEFVAEYYDLEEGQSFTQDCVYETDIAHEFALMGENY